MYYKEISFKEAWELESHQIVVRTKLYESDGKVVENHRISQVNVSFINFDGRRAMVDEKDTMFIFYKKMDSGVYKEV